MGAEVVVKHMGYAFVRRQGSYEGIGKAVGALMMSVFRRGY